jgi:hypothetical protein
MERVAEARERWDRTAVWMGGRREGGRGLKGRGRWEGGGGGAHGLLWYRV